MKRGALGTVADEQTCTVGKPAASFRVVDQQAFVSFIADGIRAGDRLRVDWIDPHGQVSLSTPYEDLPAAPSLCFITRLPIAGFAPASDPGAWSVRVVVNETTRFERRFEITGEPESGPQVASATRRAIDDRQMELTLDGRGFESNSVVHIAQYTREGGWRYLAAMLPLMRTGPIASWCDTRRSRPASIWRSCATWTIG